jgi:hypothetical protein
VSKHQIVIILGAPRSGTNMLRDAMCRLPGFATWPCDEINAMWRSGNSGYPNDALPAERLQPRIRNRIRAAFRRQARASGCSVLVEKTCANCLRVDFVAKCFPEAKFVQIVRHPVDTIASTLRRRRSRLEIGYLAKKARFVPLRNLPAAAVRSTWRRFFGCGQSAWGPVVPQHVLPSGIITPSTYAALQWVECVRSVDELFDACDQRGCSHVRYEDILDDSVAGLIDIMQDLDRQVDRSHMVSATELIRDHISTKREILDTSAIRTLTNHGSETMERHGYALDGSY